MKKTGILVGVGAAVILGGGYFAASHYYQNHFLPNTTISDINVSGLTASQATQKVKEKLKNETLTLTVGSTEWTTINKETFIDENKINTVIQEKLANQTSYAWPLAYVNKQSLTIQQAMDKTKIDNQASTFKKMVQSYNTNKQSAVNANLVYENDKIVYTEAKNGTKLEVSKATKAIQQALLEDKDTLNLGELVQKPTITKDSPSLKDKVTQMEQISKIKAYYSFNGKKVQIPDSEIKSWLMLDDNGEIALNQEKVQAYVEKMADKYNTYKHNVAFKSTKQGTVELPADIYSWSINTTTETAALSAEILKGKDFTRTPITTGSASAKGSFIGNTYIEVDLKNQHMWYYKDGKLYLDTDIVSGKPTQETPTGYFYVWNKERNTVLKGQDYASPVSYWMPIDWTGVGIHDSDWQEAYGGTRWKDGYGSHGCVNTPPTVMAKLYNATKVGTPVVILK